MSETPEQPLSKSHVNRIAPEPGQDRATIGAIDGALAVASGYNWDAAHEALESMDDFARMDSGVIPHGAYAVLRDLLTRAKEWERIALAQPAPQAVSDAPDAMPEGLKDIALIKAAHANARPTESNPAWMNTHRDEGVVLSALAASQQANAALVALLKDVCGRERLRASVQSNAALVDAAQSVVERWDSPSWKDAEPTGHVISRLRSAIAAQSTIERGERDA